jgi:RNA polymerase sigma factor (sigma-70 family)
VRLTPEDEFRLAKEGIEGNQDSRNRVVLSLLHLVWWQVGNRNRSAMHKLPALDLSSAALLDIIRNFGKWKADKGTARNYFGAVSSHAISKEIRQENKHKMMTGVRMAKFATEKVNKLEHTEDLDKLDRLLLMMPHPLVDVIRGRMAGRTFQNIGQELHYTKQRIQQLEKKGMTWLKDKFANPHAFG